MVQKLIQRLIPAAAVICLLVYGAWPAAAMGKGETVKPSLLGNDPAITATGNLHGFRLAYEAANSDGSVTAIWRLRKMAIVYLGGAGSRISTASSPKTITLHTAGNKASKKRHHLKEAVLQVSASAPTVTATAGFQRFGRDRLTATRSIAGDLANSELPSSAIRLIAAEDGKMTASPTKTTGWTTARPAGTSLNAPDITNSWCVNTLYGDHLSAVSTGCDVRRVLQNETGNNYIADDMQGMAKCVPRPLASCSGFLLFNIHMNYTFPSDNQVVHLEPLDAYSDGCSEGPSVSFEFPGFDVGLNYQEETCNNTMTPQGLGSATNVGGYWVGSCGTLSCHGSAPVGIEEVLEDHSTGHVNPDSVLVVNQEWVDQVHGIGANDTSCPNTGC